MHRGQHLLVDCRDVPREVCLDDQRLLTTLAEAAAACGATVISQIRYQFGANSAPGCTAVVMLDESHCSVHTYADLGLAAFDFFTCGTTDPNRIWDRVRSALGLRSVDVREIPRFGTGAAPDATSTAASHSDPSSAKPSSMTTRAEPVQATLV